MKFNYLLLKLRNGLMHKLILQIQRTNAMSVKPRHEYHIYIYVELEKEKNKWPEKGNVKKEQTFLVRIRLSAMPSCCSKL